MVGVLIALTADSWWAGRQERESETTFLLQLLADMRENERRIEEAIARDSVLAYWGERFVSVADARDPLPPPDSFARGLATSYSIFEPLTGTYTALLNGGGTQLLRNDSIRLQMIAYGAAMELAADKLRLTEEATWRNGERLTRATRLHRVPSAAVALRSGERWRRDLDWEAMLRDPEVVSAVTSQVVANANRLSRLRALREPTATLRRLLEAELMRRDVDVAVDSAAAATDSAGAANDP